MRFFNRIKMFFQKLFVKRKQLEDNSKTNIVTMSSLQNFVQQKKQNEYQRNRENVAVRVSDGDGLGIQGPIQE